MMLVVFAFTTELSYVKQKKVTFTSGPPGGLCGPSTGHQPPVEELFFFYIACPLYPITLSFHPVIFSLGVTWNSNRVT